MLFYGHPLSEELFSPASFLFQISFSLKGLVVVGFPFEQVFGLCLGFKAYV